MTDLTKLPDKMRRNGLLTSRVVKRVLNTWADHLESALPVWIKITDDPDTWPDMEQDVMMWWPETKHAAQQVWLDERHAYDHDAYWRPLIDLDYPPKDEP